MPSDNRVPLISVMIASMGRPSLAKTLASIAAASVPKGHALEVVIADDSADGAVRGVVDMAASGLAISIVPVGKANVSLARNACLDAAVGDWLIFVDDDEFVAPDWLEGHVSVAREFAADVVLGPVYHLYPEGTPDWFAKADPMFQDWNWGDNGRRVEFGRTGNTLIRRATLDRMGLRFDPAFGKTGGEDEDFFRRMVQAGAHIVVTDRAKAWEDVPAKRATSRYISQRQTRFGQTYALVALKGAGFARRVSFAAEALAKLVISAAGAVVLFPLNRAKAFRARMSMWSNVGKLLAVAGGELRSSWS